jgi:hypothetical protein
LDLDKHAGPRIGMDAVCPALDNKRDAGVTVHGHGFGPRLPTPTGDAPLRDVEKIAQIRHDWRAPWSVGARP